MRPKMTRLCDACFAPMRRLARACPVCGAREGDAQSVPEALPMTTRLHNRYVVGRMTGRDGLALTYTAYDVARSRAVTLREYFPEDAAFRAGGALVVSAADFEKDHELARGAQRFLEQSDRLSACNGNPHLPFMEQSFLENGTAYCVGAGGGTPLTALIEKRGYALSAGELLFALESVSDALLVIHSLHVPHGNISADTVLVQQDGTIVLAGAPGLPARAARAKLPRGLIGEWADIYLLGRFLYALSTGAHPGENEHTELPEALRPILHKMLAIHPDKRYRSVMELKHELYAVDLEKTPVLP